MKIPIQTIPPDTTAAISNNENFELCKTCGNCCNNYHGLVDASAFENMTPEQIVAYIDQGFCFDSWYGDPRSKEDPDHDRRMDVLFIRPRMKKAHDRFKHEPWGRGVCMFHSEVGGCTRTFEDRPHQCRALTPVADGSCSGTDDGMWSKQEMSIRYIPLQEKFRAALEILEAREEKDHPVFGPFDEVERATAIEKLMEITTASNTSMEDILVGFNEFMKDLLTRPIEEEDQNDQKQAA